VFVLQCSAVCCSVLQRAAMCGSVLQCVAVCCSVLQYDALRRLRRMCESTQVGIIGERRGGGGIRSFVFFCAVHACCTRRDTTSLLVFHTHTHKHLHTHTYIHTCRDHLHQIHRDAAADTSCGKLKLYTATHCNTLHHTAKHCNTPQCNATHCNTLQHTATH